MSAGRDEPVQLAVVAHHDAAAVPGTTRDARLYAVTECLRARFHSVCCGGAGVITNIECGRRSGVLDIIIIVPGDREQTPFEEVTRRQRQHLRELNPQIGQGEDEGRHHFKFQDY